MSRKKKPALTPMAVDEDPIMKTGIYDPITEPGPFVPSQEAPEAKPKPIVRRPKVKAPEKPVLPKVSLAVFLRICGKKPDQMAGFSRWAINSKLKQRSIPDWRQEYENFQRLPV